MIKETEVDIVFAMIDLVFSKLTDELFDCLLEKKFSSLNSVQVWLIA